MTRAVWTVVTLLVIGGCAGIERECSSIWASNVGADWIVVQYKMDGTPIFCWRLVDVAIRNEDRSDGIMWKDSRTGHLIHLSGWYNRVQVDKGAFESAAQLIGADAAKCT
jgi:hypothetical protein